MFQKFNLKIYIFITIFFLLIPSCTFIIGTQFIPIYVALDITAIMLLIIFFNKKLLNKCIYFYKKTPFKYLVLFFLWAILTVFISIANDHFFIHGFINSLIGGLIGSIMLPLILTLFFVPKYLSIKTCIKILYLYFWIVFLLGFLDFIIFYFDIPVLKEIITIFSNKRLLINNTTEITRVYFNDFPRARSIFDEPSHLGYFILVVSPMIYEWTLTKYRMFKNNFLNILTKKTIIPLMWTSLILTQSPIFLIFNIIFTLIYALVIRKAYRFIIKHFVTILIILTTAIAVTLYFLNKVDISTSYLNRIIVVVQNIKSLDDVIMAEQSLGIRIVVAVNSIVLGLKHFVFGVGYGNIAFLIANQMNQSPLPLTEELERAVILYSTHPPMMIFVKLFSETGVVGVLLYYTFLYRIFKNLILYKKHIPPCEYHVVNGFMLFLVIYFCSSFYDSDINRPFIFFIIGVILNLIYVHKRKKKRF